MVLLRGALRDALAAGRFEVAEGLVAALRAQLPADDPQPDLLLARALDAVGHAAGARRYWQAALRRCPTLPDADAALATGPAMAVRHARGVDTGTVLPAVPMLDDLASLARPVNSLTLAGDTLQCLALAAPAAPPRPKPLLAGTERFAPDWVPGWHRQTAEFRVRAANAYAVPGLVVSGNTSVKGHYWVNGRLCIGFDLMPGYTRPMSGIDDGGNPSLRTTPSWPLRDLDEICLVLSGAGANVYGHFLLEMLFRVLVARRLLGPDLAGLPVLLDADATGWARRILAEEFGIGAARLREVAIHGERVRLRGALVPGYLYQVDGFHPLVGELLDGFLAELPPLAPPVSGQRLFVLRPADSNPAAPRRACRNEVELAEIAARRHGFVVVSPERLPWRAQIALFAQATHLVGLWGSGMHSALFCRPGTTVAMLGMTNLAQSHIGALRGHRNAYLALEEQFADFAVDPDRFTAFLDAVMAAAPGS